MHHSCSPAGGDNPTRCLHVVIVLTHPDRFFRFSRCYHITEIVMHHNILSNRLTARSTDTPHHFTFTEEGLAENRSASGLRFSVLVLLAAGAINPARGETSGTGGTRGFCWHNGN